MIDSNDIKNNVRENHWIRSGAVKFLQGQQKLSDEIIKDFKTKNPELASDFEDFFWDVHEEYGHYAISEDDSRRLFEYSNMKMDGEYLVFEFYSPELFSTMRFELDPAIISEVVNNMDEYGQVDSKTMNLIISDDVTTKMNNITEAYLNVKKLENKAKEAKLKKKSIKNKV